MIDGRAGYPCPVHRLDGYDQRWAVGVTTVPQRRDSLLPRTLESLEAAGWPKTLVHLFVDAAPITGYGFPECAVRFRGQPPLRTFGNWWLALHELFLHYAMVADRYLMIQDDVIFCHNLRGYLERCDYPERGYWNLYTCAATGRWHNDPVTNGWQPSGQHGIGALAMVFDRKTVVELLRSDHLVTRGIINSPENAKRWWNHLDGGIVTAVKKIEPRGNHLEYVHRPSLTDHAGARESTLGRSRTERGWSKMEKAFLRSDCFVGEKFDAENLLEKKV